MLDARDFELNLEQAQAQLQSARGQLDQAQINFDRQKQLREGSVNTQAELDAAATELNSATANFDSTKSQLEKAESDLAKTKLTAPIQGVIGEKLVDPLQEVGAGEAIFSLMSENVFEVDVLVPETLIRNIDFGQSVRVLFTGELDNEVSAVVTEIGAQVSAGNAFPVKAFIGETDLDLRAGMSATVAFDFETTESDEVRFVIPISAVVLHENSGIRPEEKTAQVYVYDDDSQTVKLRTIDVIGLRDNSIEVIGGLSVGDKIVVAGVAFFE